MGRLDGRHWALLVLIVGSFLSGCGLAQRMQAREEADKATKVYNVEKADCERLYPDRNAKPATPRIKCINDAVLKRHAVLERVPGAIRQYDLVQVLATRMLVVAEQYDAGRITQAQFESERALAVSDFTTRSLQRQQAEAMTNAAQTQAAAAVAASMPRSTTCTQVGNSVTCF